MSDIKTILNDLENQGYKINLVYRNTERLDDGRQNEGIAYYFNSDNSNIAVWFPAFGLQVNPRQDATKRENMAIYWESEK